MATALAAQGTFDTISDATGASQIFKVVYALPADAGITLVGSTKVYDGDAATDPATYTVNLPTGLTAPTTWTAADFDTTGITSQDVNTDGYLVTLSDQGWTKLMAANAGVSFAAVNRALVTGKLTITPAAITVTAPNLTKVYDGLAYTDPVTMDETTLTVTGLPTNGTSLDYSAFENTSELSHDIDAGTYTGAVTFSDTDASLNGNYTITLVPGKLTITPVATTASDITVLNETKFYNGDATTDPTTFQVSLGTGLVAPTDWTAADFTVAPHSQDVGNSIVTLSDAGLAKLQAANPNYTLTTASITTGQFSITKAPVTIVAPTLTKTYDGEGYTGTVTAASITGVPMQGVAPVYTLTDLTHDSDAGDYSIVVTPDASANGNYEIHTVAGKLSIAKATLTTPTTANTPDQPANPDQPDANPQLATSIVVQGATKAYDGDNTTIPATFTVLAPSNYADTFTVPTLAATDFDTTGITSENVGKYSVTLSANGLAKLQAANPNFDFDAADVQNGLVVITPVAITIAAPTVTKAFDGTAYGPIVATVTGQPAQGVAPVYTLTDVSGATAVGSYDIAVTADAAANPNYLITTINGKLTITDNNYVLTVNYVDDAGTAISDPETQTLNYNDPYTSTAKVINGYYLTQTPVNATGKMGHGNQDVTYTYGQLGNYLITSPTDGETTTVPYQNDPVNPSQILTPTTPVISYVPGYTPTVSDGTKLVPVDSADPSQATGYQK